MSVEIQPVENRTGGAEFYISTELEQNSRGTNKTVKVTIRWNNWSASSTSANADDDFMVPLGDGIGGLGESQPAHEVLRRLHALADAALEAEMARRSNQPADE